jgi:hypothetical protein
MFFQTLAVFFRDLAKATGRAIKDEEETPTGVVIGSSRKKRKAMEEQKAREQEATP